MTSQTLKVDSFTPTANESGFNFLKLFLCVDVDGSNPTDRKSRKQKTNIGSGTDIENRNDLYQFIFQIHLSTCGSRYLEHELLLLNHYVHMLV